MMYDDSAWGWWMMALGLLLLLALVAAGVALAVAATRHREAVPAPGPALRPASAEALRELDLRFARGEIDEQAYERSRAVLDRPRT